VLRTHLIKHSPEHDRSGETACGQLFFIGRCSLPSSGEYEAQRRIGGIVAFPDHKFQPTRYACKRCCARWGEGMRTDAGEFD
jgi:hypothetical protein